jgi:cytochrome c553
MKRSALAPLFILCGLGASAAALGAGSADEGQSKSTACTACHGPNGNSANPEWPSLAGQHEQYIRKQLQAFKSGARKNPLMSPMAMSLSDDDMEDLGAYFSSQKPAGRSRSRKLAWGPRIAAAAIRAASRPALPRRMARNPAAAYPLIRAQYGTYGRRHAPIGGTRQTDEQNDARSRQHVSDEQIDAVASACSGLR